MFEAGMERINAIFAPEPKDPGKKHFIEAGLAQIDAIFAPEPADPGKKRIALEQAADALIEFMKQDTFIESAMSEFNKNLGFVSESINYDEYRPYIIESLEFLTEAEKKKMTADEFKADIKKRIDALDDKPDAPRGLVGIFMTIAPLIGAMGTAGSIMGGVAAGTHIGGFGGLLAGLGIGIGGFALTVLGVSFLSWLTTYIYNKITGNNVAKPTEKEDALYKMINELDKMDRQLSREGKPDKAKQIRRIREDLEDKVNKRMKKLMGDDFR